MDRISKTQTIADLQLSGWKLRTCPSVFMYTILNYDQTIDCTKAQNNLEISAVLKQACKHKG